MNRKAAFLLCSALTIAVLMVVTSFVQAQDCVPSLGVSIDDSSGTYGSTKTSPPFVASVSTRSASAVADGPNSTITLLSQTSDSYGSLTSGYMAICFTIAGPPVGTSIATTLRVHYSGTNSGYGFSWLSSGVEGTPCAGSPYLCSGGKLGPFDMTVSQSLTVLSGYEEFLFLQLQTGGVFAGDIANATITYSFDLPPGAYLVDRLNPRPVVSLSPSSLSFGAQQVGTTSTVRNVTLSNPGSATLAISSISANGDFIQSNNCGSTLPIGSTCSISVKFTPTQAGSRTGTLSIADNASGSPQTVSLSGSGFTPVPGGPALRMTDFDGDAKADVAVFRPANGTWYEIPSGTPNALRSLIWGSPGYVPVPGDYDGDGKTDVAVWWPGSGTWVVQFSSNGSSAAKQWGEPGDIPVPGDYDGDGKTDFAVFRPSNGTWYILPSSGGVAMVRQWGEAGDIPVPGDYDGDNKTDCAVYRPSTGVWYVLASAAGAFARQWGQAGDVPVPGDYDGDGKTDVAAWRPSSGVWYVINSSTNTPMAQQWGSSGDVPVPADYDGDHRVDVAVWRPSTGVWYVISSSTNTPMAKQWGSPGDIPVNLIAIQMSRRKRQDFDGDTKADIAVFRPSTGTWWTINSGSQTGRSQQWGQNGDVIVPGDYDGDGRADYAIFRPSTRAWWVIRSSGSASVQTFGDGSGVPAPGDYDGDGRTDLATYSPATGLWTVLLSGSGTVATQNVGTGYTPVPGDYDGDGRTDYAVFYSGTWWVLLSSSNTWIRQQWGESGDIPVPADYYGDGKTDFAIFRPPTGTWWILGRSGKVAVKQWGEAGDLPVPADYDGDGKIDLAVWRPSTGIWYIVASSTGAPMGVQWGLPTDVPISR